MTNEDRHQLPPSDGGDGKPAPVPITVTRPPHGEGITFEHLVYLSADLTRVRMGGKAAGGVSIRVNPLDLTTIQFQDPESGMWHVAHLRKDMRPHVLGRSLEEYRLAYGANSRPPAKAECDLDLPGHAGCWP